MQKCFRRLSCLHYIKRRECIYYWLLKEFNYSDAFIGGSDREKEGEWKWESGESWSYSNWGANQPDDYKAYEGGQDYLRIGQDGAWDDFNSMADISGTEIKSFICETDINEFSINYSFKWRKKCFRIIQRHI